MASYRLVLAYARLGKQDRMRLGKIGRGKLSRDKIEAIKPGRYRLEQIRRRMVRSVLTADGGRLLPRIHG